MSTSYFSFGFDHVHRLDGVTFDAETIVCITAEDPRGVMLDKFGHEWCAEYPAVPEFALRREFRCVDIIDLPGVPYVVAEGGT